jgi:hypothetical protein
VIRNALGVVAALVFGFALYSFAVVFGDSMRLGGDALNGYEANGHYYVSSHGKTTEVSREDWQASEQHATRVFVTHPLGLVAGGYLLFAFVFPVLAGRRGPDADARLAKVQASGDARAAARCGGSIAKLRMSGPLLRVAVHPGGLVVAPLLLGARAILIGEIREIRPRDGAVEIAHTSPDVRSPVALALAESSPVAQALLALERGGNEGA